MGTDSNIEWTHHTFNPWRGCQKVSAGCANCYAETLSHRNPSVLGEWGPGSNRVPAAESYWRLPRQWDRAAMKAGERRRVFCLSLGDVFEDHESLPELRRRLGQIILDTPHLDWLLLTKRPENWCEAARELWTQFSDVGFPPNVWVGASVEDQESANWRIGKLLQIPAKIRFASVEPLLGPVDLTRIIHEGIVVIDALTGLHGIPTPHADSGLRLDWVIVGGESGHRARPCDIAWISTVNEHCRRAGVPCFAKQLGANTGVHWDMGEGLSRWDRVATEHPKGASESDLSQFSRQFPIAI